MRTSDILLLYHTTCSSVVYSPNLRIQLSVENYVTGVVTKHCRRTVINLGGFFSVLSQDTCYFNQLFVVFSFTPCNSETELQTKPRPLPVSFFLVYEATYHPSPHRLSFCISTHCLSHENVSIFRVCTAQTDPVCSQRLCLRETGTRALTSWQSLRQ